MCSIIKGLVTAASFTLMVIYGYVVVFVLFATN